MQDQNELNKFRKNLPIFSCRSSIVDHLRSHQVLILSGATGSGKSTQLPQYVLENALIRADQHVIVTQPRKIAAISLATRVSYEAGAKLGRDVGYEVRFDKKCDQSAKICFCTTGILLRRLLEDPHLTGCGCVIVDEAHERTTQIDLCLALIAQILPKRPDFHLIIASATLATSVFSSYFRSFAGANLEVAGRTFPVEIKYQNVPSEELASSAASAVKNILQTTNTGDILVFMPGKLEIESCIQKLNDDSSLAGFECLPCHSMLTHSEQMRVFSKPPLGVRRVIVATNVAETSLTINGVVYVVDSGMERTTSFDARVGAASLELAFVTKASAAQRTGRAGRVQPGVCYRLYTKGQFDAMDDHTPPEIMRSRLTELLSTLIASSSVGIGTGFNFVQKPNSLALIHAANELLDLDFATLDGGLTNDGLRAAALPIDPRWAKALITAEKHGEQTLTAVATLAGAFATQNSPLRSLRSFGVGAGAIKTARENLGRSDLRIVLASIAKYYSSGNSKGVARELGLDIQAVDFAGRVREQLLRKLTPQPAPILSEDDLMISIRSCLFSGFFAQTILVGSTTVSTLLRPRVPCIVGPDSVLPTSQLAMALELRTISGRLVASFLEPVDIKLVLTSPSHYLNTELRQTLQKLGQ